MRANLGDALFELKRYAEAIACYEKVLAAAPGNRSVWLRCAHARAVGGGAAGRSDADVDRIPDPGDADTWARRAGFLAAAGRFAEAAAASDRALAINPNDMVAKRIGIGARISCCDWRRRDADKSWVSESLHGGQARSHSLQPSGDQRFRRREPDVGAALGQGIARPAKPLWNGEPYRHERVRVAYLSAEFRDHPTAILIAGVLEHHDRTRFEVTAVSLGPKTTVPLRRRIEAACERIIEVQDLRATPKPPRRSVRSRSTSRSISMAMPARAGPASWRIGRRRCR